MDSNFRIMVWQSCCWSLPGGDEEALTRWRGMCCYRRSAQSARRLRFEQVVNIDVAWRAVRSVRMISSLHHTATRAQPPQRRGDRTGRACADFLWGDGSHRAIAGRDVGATGGLTVLRRLARAHPAPICHQGVSTPVHVVCNAQHPQGARRLHAQILRCRCAAQM